jgi:hypothetical protein
VPLAAGRLGSVKQEPTEVILQREAPRRTAQRENVI